MYVYISALNVGLYTAYCTHIQSFHQKDTGTPDRDRNWAMLSGSRCTTLPVGPPLPCLTIALYDAAYHSHVINKLDDEVEGECCCAVVCPQGEQVWSERSVCYLLLTAFCLLFR